MPFQTAADSYRFADDDVKMENHQIVLKLMGRSRPSIPLKFRGSKGICDCVWRETWTYVFHSHTVQGSALKKTQPRSLLGKLTLVANKFKCLVILPLRWTMRCTKQEIIRDTMKVNYRHVLAPEWEVRITPSTVWDYCATTEHQRTSPSPKLHSQKQYI